VGIRNASITNALKTKASIKAVINHSKVFAISTALFFRTAFFELVFSVLLENINFGLTQKIVSTLVAQTVYQSDIQKS
jgi:hypothetical protein